MLNLDLLFFILLNFVNFIVSRFVLSYISVCLIPGNADRDAPPSEIPVAMWQWSPFVQYSMVWWVACFRRYCCCQWNNRSPYFYGILVRHGRPPPLHGHYSPTHCRSHIRHGPCQRSHRLYHGPIWYWIRIGSLRCMPILDVGHVQCQDCWQCQCHRRWMG